MNDFDLVNGYVVNGWDREAAKEAIRKHANVDNEWYVLVYDLEKETGDYDNLEFSDAKTAYKKFDRMKEKISDNQRLEVIYAPMNDEEDNVVVLYYLKKC